MKIKSCFLSGRIVPIMFSILGSISSRASNPGTYSRVSNFNFDKEFFFEENKGQLSANYLNLKEGQSDIKYYGHTRGVYLYCKPGMVSFELTKIENGNEKVSEATGLPVSDFGFQNFNKRHQKDQIKTKISTQSIDLIFIGSNPFAAISSTNQQKYFENFYTTGNADIGITHVHTYKTVIYKNIYANIDLILKAVGQGMEYSFLVHPGGEISDIQLAWKGVENTKTLANGGIHFSNAIGDINESAPKSFVSGREVLSHCVKQGNNYGFKVDNYDKRKDLLIDPSLTWATYYGGENEDDGNGISTDAAGNIFMVGETFSGLHIATSGAYQTSYSGNGHGLNKNRTSDVFVAKFNSLDTLEWATYYGGPGNNVQTNNATGIKTDIFGNVYIVGYTNSATGIATSGAFQTTFGGGARGDNAFLAKFNNSGTLDWATYFGGNGNIAGNSLTTDISGNVIIIAGPYLAKFSSAGTETWDINSVQGNIQGNCLTTDVSGNIYIASSVTGSGMATSGAYQTSVAGNFDAFLSKFNSSGSRIWATYFGGNNEDEAYGVALDSAGNIFIAGQTKSTTGLATLGAQQTSLEGGYDAFLAKFNNSGKLSWATYCGGTDNDEAGGICTDIFGNVVMTGTSASASGIATSNGSQTSFGGITDAFLAVYNTAGKLKWATYYGGAEYEYGTGVCTDASGNVYFTGSTSTDSGLATIKAHQTIGYGMGDAFLAKFVYNLFQNDAGIDSIKNPSGIVCAGLQPMNVYLHNAGTQPLSSVNINWAVNGVSQPVDSLINTISPGGSVPFYLGNFNFSSGLYTIKAWTSKPNGQVDSFPFNDTLINSFTVNPVPLPIGKTDSACYGGFVTIGIASISGHRYKWTSHSGFTSNISDPNIQVVFASLNILHETIIATGCSTVDSVSVKVNPLPNAYWTVNNIAKNYKFQVKDSSLTKSSYVWSFGDSSATATGYSLSHIFPKNIKYTIKLLATNKYGCISEDDSEINVIMSDINSYLNSDLYRLNIYPNPFTHKTFVEFTLPQTSHVRISVIDMKGNVLLVLADKVIDSGLIEYEINTSEAGLMPGTHFVNIEINGQVINKKIIEVR